jgi:hypothetical protein
LDLSLRLQVHPVVVRQEEYQSAGRSVFLKEQEYRRQPPPKYLIRRQRSTGAFCARVA